MKYAREIKVGVLAAICLFLLFFGFNFLKGVNVFSPTNSYHGTYYNLHGLEEQAAVYIRGHKVGQVDAIRYDFTRDSAFTIDISINKDIALPQGTRMALVADGLLGGMAVELQLPTTTNDQRGSDWTNETLTAPTTNDQRPTTNYQLPTTPKGSFLPTTYVLGLMESLQTELLAHLDEAVQDVDKAVLGVDSLVANLREQVEGDHIKHSLANVDRVSGDLSSVSSNLKTMMNNQVPQIVNNADTAIANLNTIIEGVKHSDIPATIARVDTAVSNVNEAVATLKTPVLQHVDEAVVSADSLLKDLKANPKRYVHFSIFGKKSK